MRRLKFFGPLWTVIAVMVFFNVSYKDEPLALINLVLLFLMFLASVAVFVVDLGEDDVEI